jgi:hypothetical protein
MKTKVHRFWKRISLYASLGLLAIATSGCFLRLLLGFEVAESVSEEVHLIISSVHANASTAVCRRREPGGFVECTYLVESSEFPGIPDQTSTAQLVSEFGFLGVFIDPLVLDLPAGVTGIEGTYADSGSNSGELLVYPNLSYIPVDDTRTLTASPGRQLVVVDFPAGIPIEGVDYQMSLSFQQLVPTGTGPTQIRALLAGRFRAGAKTYYPPMLPCTSDVASLPVITLPRAATLQPIALPEGFQGCENEPYRFLRFASACDLDNDQDVDQSDVSLILVMRNRSADSGDPRDIDGSGSIDVNDVRRCAVRCSRPRCS